MIQIMNNGIGPAIIDVFEIFLDGQKLSSQKSADIERKVAEVLEAKTSKTSVTTLGSGYAMPKDQARTLLEVHFPATSQDDIERIEKRLARFSLVIRYSSMYGDRYTFDPSRS